jgi:hypothetical protein
MATINAQLQNRAFGEYLEGILPPNLARAAGAFSVSMRQIKNIQNIPVQKFAQIASNNESMKNLNVNSVSGLPADLQLSRQGLFITGKGDGPYQTYTMSNFLGCMSGLPYITPWETVLAKILAVQTPWLIRTYREDYLAITWERAIGEVLISKYPVNIQPYIENPANPAYQPDPAQPNYDPNLYVDYATGAGTNVKDFQPRIDDWYYQITGVQLVLKGGFNAHLGGGGYGREGAPDPICTIIDFYSPGSGATAEADISRNDREVPGNFGRIIALYLTNAGVPVKWATTSVMQYGLPPEPPVTPPIITIECPPTAIVYPPATASNTPPGTAGWPLMNATVQDYINRANIEIKDVILVNRPADCSILNNAWNSCGNSLFFEQRARTIGLPALPPQWPEKAKDPDYARFPQTQYSFIDLMPSYSGYTQPHMYAQTIEAITNWGSLGARSGVGLMRESRNQKRLALMGVTLDNNIPDTLSDKDMNELMAIGTLPISGGDYTPVATLVVPDPTAPIILDPTAPQPGADGTIDIRPPWIPPGQGGDPNIPRPPAPVIPYTPPYPGTLNRPPYGPGYIPPPGQQQYYRNILSNSSYSVAEAIEEVILCNCDCWDGL